MQRLSTFFYTRPATLRIAQELLGKVLVTRFDGKETAGRILEVEAYLGTRDRACHAYGARRTPRNNSMYATGGIAYVYRCYGIHHLFNVVTNGPGIPHAILIRALEPLRGQEIMQHRMGRPVPAARLTRGPGNLARALGLDRSHDGRSLCSRDLFIASDGIVLSPGRIGRSPRIGVDYAGSDALLPYRFYIKGHPSISGRPVH
ncbi:MAG: hypothetical protein RJA57_1494 [Bacteroidota bacterium]